MHAKLKDLIVSQTHKMLEDQSGKISFATV